MPAPVVIEFLLRGMPAVDRAFRTVEQAAMASQRAQTQAAERGMRQRQTAVEREARTHERALGKTSRETERAYQKMVREVERAANRERAIETRKEQEIIRAREKRSREVERLAERDMRKAQQWADKQVQLEKRAAEKIERTRAANARREANQVQRDERYNANRFARSLANNLVGGTMRAGSQIARTTAQVGGMFTQLGGGFSIADSVKQRANIEREAALLSNQGFMPGDARFGKRIDPKKLIAQAKATGAATGMDTEDVIKGTRRFVNLTGDIDMAQQNQEFFAKVAKATGADMSDIAGTAGMIFAQNKKMTPAQMRETLLQVMMQSNQGAVSVEDLSRVGGKLTKTSASYAGDQTETQRRLLGLAQIGITTGGNPAETQTMIAKLGSDAVKKQKKVKALLKSEGMKDIFNEEGQITTTPDQLVTTLLQATGGNTGKLQSIMGDRSIKLFQAVQQPFLDAKHEAMKSGKTEREANKIAAETVQRDIMEKTIGRKYGEKDMEADVKAVLDSGAEQFDKSMRDLKNEVGEALIPEFQKLIPEVRKLTPQFVELLRLGLPAFIELMKTIANFVNENKKAIALFAKHPFATIVSYHLAQQFGSTIVAEALRTGIAKMFATQVGGQVVGGAGAPAALAAGAPIGSRVGAASAGAAGGVLMGGMMLQGAVAYDAYNRISGSDEKAVKAIEAAKGGDVTAIPAAIEDAKKRSTGAEAGKATVTDISRFASFSNPLSALGMFASDMVTEKLTGKNAAVDQSKSYHDAQSELKKLSEVQTQGTEVNKALIEAIKANTAAQSGAKPGEGGKPPAGPAASQGVVQRAVK